MGHIEATRHLDATPDAIWATVSDTSTWDKWFSIHEKWMEEPPTQLAEGSKLVAKIVMLGMANKIEWTVTQIDPPRSLSLTGTGLAGVKCDFTFTVEPEDDGSKFTVAGDFEGALIKGALAKAVEKDGASQLDKSLDQLSALAAATA
ncbi:SRPBCC family protein [Skermania piniformis]|uniref:SRPBCC family protein n=1 Tax=Skermania pinensis TaxID=39122 RepID=A0ABX8SBP8_9ACTN|nr:SRPBCC family protein [Skermania piniformis]QXQ14419.1 SRPBCC family protein [Skermania piniformis]